CGQAAGDALRRLHAVVGGPAAAGDRHYRRGRQLLEPLNGARKVQHPWPRLNAERVREAPIVPAQRARALRRGNLLGTEPRVALAQLLPAPAGEGLKQLRVLQRQQLVEGALPAAAVIERRPQHRQQPASTQAVDACTWPPRSAPGGRHAARLPASVASGRSAIAAPTSCVRTRLLSLRSAIVRATRNTRCW